MPPELPLISAIIPAYQSARTLGRALDSVLQQDYPALEAIVADDGSTDETPRVVETYQSREPRVHYQRQENQGVGATRNLAIAHSSGEYLALLDADDEWRPGKLARQAAIFAQRPAVGLVFTNGLGLNLTNGRSRPQSEAYAHPLRVLRRQATEVFEDGFVLGPNQRRVLLQTNFIAACTVMLRRSLFDQVGPFMREPGPEDYDYWIRASRLTQFAYCSGLYATHYDHALSTSRSEAWFIGLVKYQKRCLTSPDYADVRPEVRRNFRRQYRMLVFYYGRQRRPRQAWAAFRASLEAGFDGLSALCALGSVFGPLPFKLAGRLVWP